MKIALDVHGVISKDPQFFRSLAQAVIHAEGQVHILTGKHLANGILEELEKYDFHAGVHYTHLFSISDYHQEIGTPMWGDVKNPFMDDAVWSKTKAEYCQRNQIDLCLDDTERYLPYFTTGVALYQKKELATYPIASKFTDESEQ